MGRAIQILRCVGLVLCGLSAVLTVTNSVAGPNAPPSPVALTVLLPFALSALQSKLIGTAVPIAIAAMFWRSTSERERESPSQLAIVLLACQTLLAFLVAEELQFVVAVETGLLLSARAGALWVAAQASAAWGISALHPELMAWIIPQSASQMQRLIDIGIFMLVAMMYNFLAFSLGLLAAAEGRQRRALEGANRELREAQRGVAEAARMAERLHLARELHDAIGHQLSALSINLQVASRLSQDQARRPVLEAYQLTGLLLSDLRAVVSATRMPEITDLESALRAVADRVKKPQIHLNLVEAPIALGHALFRCAQEIITNAARHSGAEHIWIETRASAECYTLTAWDDGSGNAGLRAGNGLRGIRERVTHLNGECDFRNREGAGFEIVLRLPLNRPAA